VRVHGQPSLQLYYLRIVDEMRRRLSHEDPEYLLNVDFDEYLDHALSEAEWQPLEYDVTQMTVEPFVAKTSVVTSQGTFARDEPRFRLRIPVAPHPQRQDFLNFQPPTIRSSGEPQWHFEGDWIVVETPQSEQAVARIIDDLDFWIGGRNREIEAGNARIQPELRRAWEERRRQVEAQHGATQAILGKLNVRLHQDPNAPVRPVEIRPRQLRTVVPRPQASATREPSIRHDDVLELVDFIERYARQFEVTPVAYSDRDEEQLRDLLIGMMNVNYPGAATGETFNKLGKTDICFRVDKEVPLIAECKFWSGPKAYGGALHQLFGYLTWRQTYGILVHFCKVRDMTKAVEAATERMQADSTFLSGSLTVRSETRFVTRHTHPQDDGRLVEVHHLFFDLSTP